MANQREASKQNWESRNTVEDINSGSLQRIADAVEKMASNYTRMEHDLALYKRWYKEEMEVKHKVIRSNNSLRGYITRLKKQNEVK